MAQASDPQRLQAAYEQHVRELHDAVARRERSLAILSEVAARIHGSDDVGAILDTSLEVILARMGLKTAWIFLGDEKERKLRLAAHRGVGREYLDEIGREGLGECLCPEVFWTGHRMQARNTTQCPRMPTIVEGLKAPVAHACIPLSLEGHTRGVLNVAARPGELFAEDELHFLETLGHQMCIAVERAEHLRAERARNQEARAMAAINRAIGTSLDADSILRAVAETARTLLDAEQVVVLMGSDPRRVAVGHVSGDRTGALQKGEEIDMVAKGWRLPVLAIGERALMKMDDSEADERVDPDLARVHKARAALVTPLLAREHAIGALMVTRSRAHAWTQEQLELAESLASQAALAIDNARLFEEARRALDAERLRNQEARAMAAINKAIGGSLDPGSVLRAVGQTALEVLDADRVHIFLGSEPEHLVVGHVSGLPHPELKDGQALDLVATGARAQAIALRERRSLHVDDWSTDPRVNRKLARRWGMGSAVVEPLLARQLTLGLLVVSRSAARKWTPEQLDVAGALAAQASVALENARLYDESRRAYQDLKTAQQRILQTEKMAVLGTFASGLAHEVRNPLNSIALQLSVLERRLGRLGTEAAAPLGDLIVVIREEIKRLDALVGDFLLFSRANRLQYEPASLEVLTDEVVRLLRPESRAAGVTLRRQGVGEPIPEIPMDGERIKQVVINLVKNAVEAVPGGGVVVVETGVVDGEARVAVRDDGPGLPEGLDIFQLFVTTKAKGTGLGLSIAQQIVLEHGGEITARNLPGKGAEFVVALPVEPARPAEERTS